LPARPQLTACRRRSSATGRRPARDGRDLRDWTAGRALPRL